MESRAENGERKAAALSLAQAMPPVVGTVVVGTAVV